MSADVTRLTPKREYPEDSASIEERDVWMSIMMTAMADATMEPDDAADIADRGLELYRKRFAK